MQITGKATVKVDGEELLSEVSATLNVGGVEREAMMGPRGVQGFQESPVAPSLNVPVRHTADTDLIAFSNITKATVIFTTDTGDAYMLRRAFTTNPMELQSGDGNASLQMSCMGLERL